ncbi:MAG: GFA family protein [Stenotrophomonas sp.]|uniref:GFA family protein n=1 Tax=Stenotrophomonas sp. TaxID=69392 RepID=UPI003D6C790F
MQTHNGSCHCGTVVFEFDAPVTGILECNCSICHRKGALWHAVSKAQFRIVSGEARLTHYQFGTRTAKHFFCSQCGTSTFSNPRIAPHMWVVNLRCVDGIDLTALPRQSFDGRNWEEAARQLMMARNSAATT